MLAKLSELDKIDKIVINTGPRDGSDSPAGGGRCRPEVGVPSCVRGFPELTAVPDGQEARTSSAAGTGTAAAGALARQTRRAFAARSSSSV